MPKRLEKFDTHGELMAHRKMFGKYQEYAPEFVYGGIDGAVTTFAVVAASAGAELGAGVILILGISNMLADGISMSVGSFLSTKTEVGRYRTLKLEEYAEIEKFPEDEVREIREIYEAKGFKGRDLEMIVTHITSDKDLWVKEMMIGEHGLNEEESKSPKMNALMTFVSFCILGSVPIAPYVYSFVTGNELSDKFLLACIFTGVAFALIGYLKGVVNNTSRLKAVVETLFLGGVAAFVAYGAGDWLEKIIA